MNRLRFLVVVLALATEFSVAQPGAVRSAPTLEEDITAQRQCIADADSTIAQQHRIAHEVGLVDKVALYQAGASKVHCSDRLKKLIACQRARGCAGVEPDPYAPTRVQYEAPSASMP